MTDFSNFHISTADWRKQLKINRTRTRKVIIAFILLYMLIGFIIDILLYSEMYRQATLSQIVTVLITLQVFPYGTVTMGVVAAIALWVTFKFHNRLMLLGTEYTEVKAGMFANLEEQQLYNVVEEMKVASGLNFMPKVFIIEAPYMNAFASGYSEKSAMVAITRGLMQKLNRQEMQAVMAHELSHIRHQDIKLTLMASVLSNILLIVVDILFYNLIFNSRRKMDARIVIVIVVLRYVLPLITVLLFLYLSRTREYMADAGCVELMRDNHPLASALMKIHQDHQQNIDEYRQIYGDTPHEDVRRAAYVYDPVSTGADPVKSIFSAFSTHPSLEKRLKAIGFVAKGE